MEQEIWKDIKGFEGQYQISTFGNVRSVYKKSTKILVVFKTEKGYLRAKLHSKNKKHYVKVHRLVAQAFIPNPDNKPQINHKDGNKLNNHIDNLEWVTDLENKQHASLYLPQANKRGGKKPIALLVDGKEAKRFGSISQAAKEMNLSTHHIYYQLLINKVKPKERHLKWVYL